MKVAVLFAREKSVYMKIDGCDVYDARRDARTYAGSLPVIAHPPCRAWGRFSYKAKATEEERQLGFHAVAEVRRCGGVLEHPAWSQLWTAANLPFPGEVIDPEGGWTLPVYQGPAGHRAPKDTWLYIVGISRRSLPSMPFALGLPPGRVELMGKAEREATPEPFARWLVELATICVGSAAAP